jgi:hypothetical protein
MLPVDQVAELRLKKPAGASQTTRVEAASGLAILGTTVYVIADDEIYLAVFRDMGRREGDTTRLLEGRLSEDPNERKKKKPDLESLTPLAPFGPFEHGGLIALGSGSGNDRNKGAVAILDADGGVDRVVQVEAGPLFEELGQRVTKLNLEGTATTGDVMRILQRGNEPGATNAHIDLDLAKMCDAIASGAPLTGDLVRDIHEHDLGAIRGTKLCFSDADTLEDGRIVFSASAESQTDDTDGAPVGSAIGVMTPDGEITSLDPIEVATKVEGLAAERSDGQISAYMVTDNDDPDQPTALLRAALPDRG